MVKLAGDDEAGPGHGPDHDDLRQPAAGPVHDVRAELQRRPARRAGQPARPAAPSSSTRLLTPWSGTAPKTATATFTIDQGCDVRLRARAERLGASSTAAGPPGRRGDDDRQPHRRRPEPHARDREPAAGPGRQPQGRPGLPGRERRRRHLPGDTRGSARSNAPAGSGDAPVALAGTVYLTGPTDGGLAGLAITLPGKVGPVDLGTVVTRAGILLRPDGGLTVKTRPLPAIVGGVPVSIRSLALTLDRPGFILNASSCAPQQVDGAARGRRRRHRDGQPRPTRRPTAAALKFTPKLEATLGARRAGPSPARSRR